MIKSSTSAHILFCLRNLHADKKTSQTGHRVRWLTLVAQKLENEPEKKNCITSSYSIAVWESLDFPNQAVAYPMTLSLKKRQPKEWLRWEKKYQGQGELRDKCQNNDSLTSSVSIFFSECHGIDILQTPTFLSQ